MPELSLDDRQLLVELQSLGVRVIDETAGPLPGRRGGAGPSDALFLWVRGLPLTVPSHAGYVDASPYTVRVEGRRATLYRDDELVGPVTLPPRPRIYDMETADGVPYWKIALLHLDSIASTVVQKCIYWDTPEQCGFCGIELTRGEQTIPVKTPAQLAEVCTAARDYDHAVDVDADHGLAEPARPRRDLHLALRARRSRRRAGCRSRCSSSRRTTCACSTRCAARASTRSASTPRRSIPRCSRGSRRARRSAASRATSGPGSGRSRCSAAAAVTTYVLLGMGERPELIIDGCRRAIEMGVYPFVVPLRPVPGTLMADDADARSRLRRADLRRGRRRCSPTRASTIWTRRPAARAARRARGSRRGSACCKREDGAGHP